MTTGQARELAWEASQNGDFLEAINLYKIAIANYPKMEGQSAIDDMKNLKERIFFCKEMAAII